MNIPSTKAAHEQQNKTGSKTGISYKTALAALTVTASVIGALGTIAGAAQTMVPAPTAVPSQPVASNQSIRIAALHDDSGVMLDAYADDGRKMGVCPLAATSIDAKLSGYLARVDITQTFTNPYKHKIEAIYNLPMSSDAAVDSMTIRIGERTIKGEIKRKNAARKIYARARQSGQVAALLEQQRANIFTQNIANIEPGKSIVVKISYVELLKFEDGRYSFRLPTTIGKRFFAQSSDLNSASNKLAQALNLTSGGSTKPGNIEINVDLQAGMPIKNIKSTSYPILVDKQSDSRAAITLQKFQNLPNKDFVLTYEMEKPDVLKSGYLASKPGKNEDGYATFMMLPPAKMTAQSVAPREMIFLIDCSGSQFGKPIEKAKETLHYIVDHMNYRDTFQILAFNSEVKTLAAEPVSAGVVEKLNAHAFINDLVARGGTWMTPAVKRVLRQPKAKDVNRLRIVTFMTDGFVGNEHEIMNLVKSERGNSRWFTFGTGEGVNNLLIDAIAKLGGGEAEVVSLNSSAEEVSKKFYNRIASPALTDIKLKAEGITLYDVYPSAVADVWANKPLYFTARYKDAAAGKVILSGFAAGKPYQQELKVVLPDHDTGSSAIEKVWARQKIDSLIECDLAGMASGHLQPEIEAQITKLAESHQIMSDFTSFIAVDSAVTNDSECIPVPIGNQVPEGTEPPTLQSSTQAPVTAAVSTAAPVTAAVSTAAPVTVAVSTPAPATVAVNSSPVTVAAVAVPALTQLPANIGATLAPSEPAEILQGGYKFDHSAPVLTGATNGTAGSETTIIQGVNTASTVRVDNLRNAEVWLKLIAIIGGAAVALAVVWRRLFNKR